MKVEIQRHGSVNVIAPRDALTESTTAELRQELQSELGQPGVRMVLNMAHVPYVDSAGIEYLLGLAGDASAGSLRPRLADLTDTVREALFLTSTLKRFYVFESVEDAVRSYV
ncbi:MAG: STAS domain-containing protein [Planctomycetes bacterium]|nr:STAS domain-containing protein [Planctomycetota bacterium]